MCLGPKGNYLSCGRGNYFSWCNFSLKLWCYRLWGHNPSCINIFYYDLCSYWRSLSKYDWSLGIRSRRRWQIIRERHKNLWYKNLWSSRIVQRRNIKERKMTMMFKSNLKSLESMNDINKIINKKLNIII